MNLFKRGGVNTGDCWPAKHLAHRAWHRVRAHSPDRRFHSHFRIQLEGWQGKRNRAAVRHRGYRGAKGEEERGQSLET